MTATYYASIVADPGAMKDPTVGTSSTSGDIIELRMGNGTYAPTRNEVIEALRVFERWVIQGGLSSAGVNVPLPTGTA